ncbi:uncharacterized protein B0H18DRAFT_1082581 [Fomitopsis serialis]|uniref:uncharacterized protein n=1 Tax=Fomitopsis serialis TaxID=139415 RepID=UPI0020083502|nr:uncharacterized protein B0H18DRAFT_1082581 [Neoantrodia serialis]KAH9934804.1 hypothetical protein B0H18DRAFT_1082581 [Neoantrodia serialis]
MPRFFTGDELGSVKAIRCSQDSATKEWKSDVQIISSTASDARPVPVQKLAFSVVGADRALAAARGDGSASVHRVPEGERPRLKPGQRYVGLSLSENRVFSCTSNGALRSTTLGEGDSAFSAQTSVLPMRLCEWRLSPDSRTFAYGGDEVELSVWDTETRPQHLPHIPPPSSSTSQHHLLAGTHHGHVRRYDTRAARRPVADWKGIGKVGGVRMVEKGLAEHEAFVSDNGSNLFALDLRNGRVIYGYKSTPSRLPLPPIHSHHVTLTDVAGRCLRRGLAFPPRLRGARPLPPPAHHVPPPKEPGQQQEHKGEVLDKLYMKRSRLSCFFVHVRPVHFRGSSQRLCLSRRHR